jgi:hypothetical protein
MKKLGLLVLFFLSIVLLAGCQEAKPTADTFVVEVRDLSGNVLFSEEVIYPENTELGLVELIDEAIDLDYEISQWGAFIKGIHGHYPKEYGVTYNYYWGLYVNDVSSMTGLDQVAYEEDMVISFRESTMLTSLDLEIDAWIESFIATHITSYLNENVMSQYVLAALSQLGFYGYTIPDLKTLSYPVFGGSDIASVFKKSLVMRATDQTITEAMLNDFLALTPNNPYEAVTYLNAFDVLYQTASHEKRNTVVSYLQTEEPSYMDADYAGMALNAVSSVKDSEAGLSIVTAMKAYILDHLSKDGVVSWGNPNASSTAAIILGLLAIGEDPRSEMYTVEGTDLIEALMLYAGETGFKYGLTDTLYDLAFSTPQAFAALVAYKIVRDQLQWSTKQLNLWVIG